MIGEELDSNRSGNFEGTPVFITTSEIDEWVPVSRVEETASIFKGMNAKVSMKIYTDREHEVSEDEINQINEMISVV